MSIDGSRLPDLSRRAGLVIPDLRILTPNDLVLVGNGLDMGGCVAHLRVIATMLGKAYYVPVTESQLDTLGSQINDVLMQVNPQDYPKGA